MDKTTADPLVGKTVAQYEVVAKLGGGGMGIVYAARDMARPACDGGAETRPASSTIAAVRTTL